MDGKVVLYYLFGGRWSRNDSGELKWSGELESNMVIVNRSETELTYEELIEAICSSRQMVTEETKLTLSYFPNSTHPSYRTKIFNDYTLQGFLIDRIGGVRSLLYVEYEHIGNHESVVAHDTTEVTGFNSSAADNMADTIEYAEMNLVGFAEMNHVEDCEMTMVLGDEMVPVEDAEMNVVEGIETIETFDAEAREMVGVDIGQGCSQTFTFDDGLGITIGHEFASKEEVIQVVTRRARESCFEFKTEKSDKNLWEVKCKFANSGCQWRLRVAKFAKSTRFSVRTHIKIHTCTPVSQENDTSKGSGKLVLGFLKENYAGRLDLPTPRELMKLIKQHYGVDVSYYMAYRATKQAVNLVWGKPEEHYKRLPTYLSILKKKNDGTVTHLELETDGDGKRFKYMFFALGACIRGWYCMRKVIAVDATFLKGKYGGTLIVATAQDGNHQQYPIAWGVVDSENDRSWGWFMRKMKEIIPDESNVVILSDRHKSIIKAVAEVYQFAEHGFCVWHISQNVKTLVNKNSRDKKNKKGDGVAAKFMKCARAYTKSEFHSLYEELIQSYPNIAEYLEGVPLEKWARAYFTGQRYNLLTTNGAESINAVLRTERKYPLLGLLNGIIGKVIDWFNSRRLQSSRYSQVTPFVEKELHNRYVESTKFAVKELNGFTREFCVKDQSGKDFMLNLSDRTCDCKVFDIDKVPCSHAIAAAHFGGYGNDIPDMCSRFYKGDTWCMAYVNTIYPINTDELSIPPEIDVWPPIPSKKRSKGRPQEKRHLSVGERRPGKKRQRKE